MTRASETVRAGRRDRRRTRWLLLVPLLLVACPPLYDRVDPVLLGIPFFYWYQLAVIPVGALCMGLVYRSDPARRRVR